MHKKIIVICGTTATGKSELSLQAALKSSPASIISVDSRQAYCGLDIVTGKDIPAGFKKISTDSITYSSESTAYFEKDSIRLWGVDFVSPKKMLNLSEFVIFAWSVIEHEQKENRQIIIEGGSGLYLKALTQPMPSIHIPPDAKLRRSLEELSLRQLQQELDKLDSAVFSQLNPSDRNNPRRLIRRIELLNYHQENWEEPLYFAKQKSIEFVWLGLKTDLSSLHTAIENRVKRRLEAGAIDEVIALKKKYPLNLPIFSSLGVRQIMDYLADKIDYDSLATTWSQAEFSYAKRQLTWFKKQPNIIWYDKEKDYQEIVNQITTWPPNEKIN